MSHMDDYRIERDARGCDHIIDELRRETLYLVGFIWITLSENICFRHDLLHLKIDTSSFTYSPHVCVSSIR